ncbi:outer membrane beta-barrel protein [Ferruginibacter sp. SUN002]|uniref:outer membrane beta-barrel protein n=1 Tax=Ferruginibacter sp. SUN002 TaxID=2937789 RepID=UPI003D36ADD5
MIKKISLFLLLNCFVSLVFAQDITLTGKLIDNTDKTPVVGSSIRLKSNNDSGVVKTVITDSKGEFTFTGLNPTSYTLTTSNLNYENISQKIVLQASNKQPIVIPVTRLAATLEAVTVVGKVAPVKQKGDTTEFTASQYKVNPDATAEDLIKKMPGISVDASGNVTTLGDQVKKVTVDGRDFFGDDATAALKNLPAEVIDKIQVFDRLSDQAAFTGFDDGNSVKTINIITKKGMANGQFGRVYAGYGTDNRYTAGGNVNLFKGAQRISILGMFNNINQQNFSSEDLLGVNSSSSSGGGGRGGGGGGNRGGNFGGGGNNFLVGQTNGISKTNAFGINYSDQWSKKVDVTGSYFFNNSNTGNNQNSNTQYFIKGANDQFYDETNTSSANNFNHRLNLRLNYKIDDKNTLTFTPSISFQKNSSYRTNEGTRYVTATNLVSTANSSTRSDRSGYNSSNSLLYRHAFAKKGRTISLNLTAGYNDREGDVYLNSNNKYYTGGSVYLDTTTNQFTDQLVNGNNYAANISYTEPIGKKGQLQFSYSPSVTNNKSDQRVFRFDDVTDKYSELDTAYSNKFDNKTISHTTEAGYRVGDKDNMFNVGVSYRYLELNSDQVFPNVLSVNKNFNNVLPNLMWRKKISPKSNIRLFYRANTNTPSINQLQNVIDNSNILFLRAGNPDLKQQVSNTIGGRYTFNNTQKSTSFFANIFVQQADNYIANATYIAAADSLLDNGIVLYKGSQLSKPTNLDGYISLRSLLTYSMPLSFIKSTLNLSGGVSYSKTPGLVNSVSSVSNNYTYNTGVVLASNISQYIDYNLSYNVNFNNTKNSINSALNTNYVSQNARLQVNLLDKKGWFLQNDVSNATYSGLSSGFNQSYWLWNAAVGKKFLKNQAGELKLSVFDLLKQNQSITRTVDPTYIEDVRNQVLQQYFMLTFTYKLKSFGITTSTNNKVPLGDRPPGGPGAPGF